jgi:hypothetical protein
MLLLIRQADRYGLRAELEIKSIRMPPIHAQVQTSKSGQNADVNATAPAAGRNILDSSGVFSEARPALASFCTSRRATPPIRQNRTSRDI